MSNHLIVEEQNTLRFNLLMLPVALVICAVVGGVLAYVSYNFFSLVIAFPIFLGLAAGMTAQQVIKRTDGERTWWAALLAILLALFTYGVYRYAEYYLTFDEFGAHIKAIATFQNYLNWSAEQGINISRTSGSSSGFDLQGQGVWIFWGVEVLIMLFVALGSSHAGKEEEENGSEEEAV